MIRHTDINSIELWQKIKSQDIAFGGNSRLKIYGTLKCISGKRMKKENRVFFACEKEALEHGYRPCGHCMRKSYRANLFT
jgi:methylphosphotriester-DNA--protein-cysteine methyltransferase